MHVLRPSSVKLCAHCGHQGMPFTCGPVDHLAGTVLIAFPHGAHFSSTGQRPHHHTSHRVKGKARPRLAGVWNCVYRSHADGGVVLGVRMGETSH